MFSKDKIIIVLVAWRGLGTSCLDVCWTAVLSEGHEEIHGVLSFHNQRSFISQPIPQRQWQCMQDGGLRFSQVYDRKTDPLTVFVGEIYT